MALPVSTVTAEHLTVQDINRQFYDAYGAAMSEQPIRFGIHFGQKSRGNKLLIRKHIEQAARKHLGGDLDAVGHQRELVGFLAQVLNAEAQSEMPNHDVLDLSIEQISLLALTCSLHDIGEHVHLDLRKAGLTPVGDIQSGTKTGVDRQNERQVRYFHYENRLNNLPADTIRRMEGLIAHKPEPGDELLHDIYELSHHLQLLDTSAKATYAYQDLFGDRIPLSETRIKGTDTIRPGVKNRLGSLAHGLAYIAYTAKANHIRDLQGQSHPYRGVAPVNYAARFAAARAAVGDSSRYDMLQAA